MHDCYEFPPRFNQYFNSYYNITAQLYDCTTNSLFVTMVTNVRENVFVIILYYITHKCVNNNELSDRCCENPYLFNLKTASMVFTLSYFHDPLP